MSNLRVIGDLWREKNVFEEKKTFSQIDLYTNICANEIYELDQEFLNIFISVYENFLIRVIRPNQFFFFFWYGI